MSPFSTEPLALALLDPQATNPNVMSPARFAALRAAMQEHGCLEPVIVVRAASRFRIVSGHHRVLAARELGWDSIPCVIAPLTPEQEAKVLLGMNRIRGDVRLDLAGDILRALLDEHMCDPASLISTGYSEREIDALTKSLEDATEEIERDAMETETPSAPSIKPFIIEIEFTDGDAYRKTLRKLRKASGGRGADLAIGLMRVLEIEGAEDGQ